MSVKIPNSRHIEQLAQKLMRRYISDSEWKFKIAYGKYPTAVAWCNPEAKVIEINTYYIGILNHYEVYDVILHEIAHALCSEGAHHNKEWKRKCRSIGGSGEVFVQPYGRDIHKTERDKFMKILSIAQVNFRYDNPSLWPIYETEEAA